MIKSLRVFTSYCILYDYSNMKTIVMCFLCFLLLLERKERRGIEIEIEEAEKKRKPRDDRDIKTKDRYESKRSNTLCVAKH